MTTYYKGCKLTSGILTQAKTGTPSMALTFQVMSESGPFGRVVFLYLSDGAMPYTIEKLERLGFNGDFNDPQFTNGDDVELSMQEEEYNGKPREKWDIAGGGMKLEPAKPDVARQLSARWRATHPATGKPPAKPAAPAPSKAPPKGPAKSSSKATDKDTAWDEYRAACNNGDEGTIAEHFYTSIAKIAENTGRDEGSFTVDDWKAVADDATPF